MTVDEKIETLRKLVADHEGREGQMWAIVRGNLGEIEEELRSLRVEKATREIEYFTRAQFAKRLQISRNTLARAEERGEIEPALQFEATARYTSLQFEHAGEIFRKVRNPDGSMKRGPVPVRKAA